MIKHVQCTQWNIKIPYPKLYHQSTYIVGRQRTLLTSGSWGGDLPLKAGQCAHHTCYYQVRGRSMKKNA